MDDGYIKLNRKILSWGWFSDSNTVHVFLYCLLNANWKPGEFLGSSIDRGQFATSLAKIAADTGLSIQNVRTALKHLELTGELTSKSQGKYRIITVLNYCRYQDINKVANSELTANQQGTNKELTSELTTIEEYKKGRKKEEKNIYTTPLPPSKGRTQKQRKGDKNIELFDKMFLGFGFSDRVMGKLIDWMRYKGEERNFEYKETGLKALLTQVKQNVDKHGDSAVIDCINLSMSNGWQGIFWDKIEQSSRGGYQQNTASFMDVIRDEIYGGG